MRWPQEGSCCAFQSSGDCKTTSASGDVSRKAQGTAEHGLCESEDHADAGTGLGSGPTFCRALLTMSKVSDSGAAATQMPRRLLAMGNALDSLKHHPCRHTELQRFKNGVPRPWPLHWPSETHTCPVCTTTAWTLMHAPAPLCQALRTRCAG